MAPGVEWAMASRSRHPDQESGDASLVLALPTGAIVGVVDGLGHGPEASAAARRAIALLAESNGAAPLDALRRCHDGLRSTRGAVMGVAWFDAAGDTMTWLGVGNVAGVVLRAGGASGPRREMLLTRGGVVGRQLPPLQPRVLPIGDGDVLAVATDGVRESFATAMPCPGALQPAANGILADFGADHDDALVVVVRYRGAPA
jgi:negative regulator of sigma-B (phosphoserine phosphatase)